MFSKPPLKTYGGKKSRDKTHQTDTSSYLITNSSNRIIRTDISSVKELQPTEYRNFDDKDETLDYDPFETTFDRLLKDARLPPPPSDHNSASSYETSSSDSTSFKNTSSDEELVAPFVELKSQPTQRIARKRRNAKGRKISKYDMVITPGKLTQKTKLHSKVKKLPRYKNENMSPNVKHAPITSGTKKNKQALTNPSGVEPQSKKPRNYDREDTKRKNVDVLRGIRQCSVSLQRLPISLAKTAALNGGQGSGKKICKTIPMTETLEQESKKGKKLMEAWLNNESTGSSYDPAAEAFTAKTTTGDGKTIMDSFKNPIVILPPLEPKRSFIHKFSSSTPIGPRTTNAKCLPRLSPIMNDMAEDISKNDHFEETNLPQKLAAQDLDPVPSTSTNILSRRNSTKHKLAKSSKRILQVLSDTPDSDPSELLFNDTDAMMHKSSSLPFAEERPDVTMDNSLIAIEKESSTHESFHLTYEENDEKIDVHDINDSVSYPSPTTQKKQLSHASSLSSVNDINTMESSMEEDCIGFSKVQDRLTEDENKEDDESQNLDDDDDWSTISGSLITTGEKRLPETGKTLFSTNSNEKTARDDISDSMESHSKIEAADEKLNESVAAKEAIGKKEVLPSLQPIVLLSKLKIPLKTSARVESIYKPSSENSSDTLNSVLELNTDCEAKSFSQTKDDLVSLEASANEKEMLDANMEKSVIEVLPKQDENPESSLNNSSITITEPMEMEKKHASLKDACGNLKELLVLVPRFNDQYGITQRRKKYRNFSSNLSAISENRHPKKVLKAVYECSEEVEDISNSPGTEASGSSEQSKPKANDQESRVSTQTGISQASMDTVSVSSPSNKDNESTEENKIVFLKPGKSWARSLSILNQVHSQDDFESLSVGKGRKWRGSVQHLFEMQSQGLIQSCVKKNEDDKVSRSYSGFRDSTISPWIPGSSQPNPSKLLDLATPGRFVRRISIRVVPDGRSCSRIADTSFLEAYGITQTEDRKTFERRTVIAPRKTSIYNATYERTSCIDDLTDPQKNLDSLRPREVVLVQCGQESSLPFEECYPKSYLENCRKIGEGVFGEVFLYQKNNMKTVIKIIPIEGELMINGERQKKFDEILSEIVIAKQLHNLRFDNKSKTSSFVEVNNVRCVKGKYPDTLIRLWNEYDEEKNSENDSPSIFDENQLYIVLELGHGGEDLEAFVFHNSTEAHALFMQTAFALAVAEESHEFEHRDLHWGNLLISRTDDTQIDFKLGGKSISVTSKGVKVSVIDFTLSRMSYQGCSIFNDLSLDDDLFSAQGEYQFDIYRLMKQKLENNWQRFEPYTNILWLHYVLDKMVTAVRYRRATTKIHKNGIGKLQELKDEILNYKSCVDFVTNCDAVRLHSSRSSISTVEAMD